MDTFQPESHSHFYRDSILALAAIVVLAVGGFLAYKGQPKPVKEVTTQTNPNAYSPAPQPTNQEINVDRVNQLIDSLNIAMPTTGQGKMVLQGALRELMSDYYLKHNSSSGPEGITLKPIEHHVASFNLSNATIGSPDNVVVNFENDASYPGEATHIIFNYGGNGYDGPRGHTDLLLWNTIQQGNLDRIQPLETCKEGNEQTKLIAGILNEEIFDGKGDRAMGKKGLDICHFILTRVASSSDHINAYTFDWAKFKKELGGDYDNDRARNVIILKRNTDEDTPNNSGSGGTQVSIIELHQSNYGRGDILPLDASDKARFDTLSQEIFSSVKPLNDCGYATCY